MSVFARCTRSVQASLLRGNAFAMISFDEGLRDPMIPQQGNLFSEGGMCVGVNIRGRWASNEYLVRMNTGVISAEIPSLRNAPSLLWLAEVQTESSVWCSGWLTCKHNTPITTRAVKSPCGASYRESERPGLWRKAWKSWINPNFYAEQPVLVVSFWTFKSRGCPVIPSVLRLLAKSLQSLGEFNLVREVNHRSPWLLSALSMPFKFDGSKKKMWNARSCSGKSGYQRLTIEVKSLDQDYDHHGVCSGE
ncbi:hypothetical protein AFLA_013860 [Aspergillus flavus NRRL3357]|nr:hypothetical protein AFLA_013860 [Aspergillus flavus NRRL3357]